MVVAAAPPGLRPARSERVLSPELGRFIRALHADHGVVFHLGEQIDGIGRDAVVLKSGCLPISCWSASIRVSVLPNVPGSSWSRRRGGFASIFRDVESLEAERVMERGKALA